MSATCQKAIRSLRVIARINMRQARAAKSAGHIVKMLHHVSIALSARRDANALFSTAR